MQATQSGGLQASPLSLQTFQKAVLHTGLRCELFSHLLHVLDAMQTLSDARQMASEENKEIQRYLLRYQQHPSAPREVLAQQGGCKSRSVTTAALIAGRLCL